MLLTKRKMATAATLLTVLAVGDARLNYQGQAAGSDKALGSRGSKSGQPKPPAADTGMKLGQKTEDKNEIFDDGVSSSVILRRNVEEYNEIFDDLLDAVDDCFEVAYTNRYEGRIDTTAQLIMIQPIHIRRRAQVFISIEDSGGFLVSAHVEMEVENKTNKSDKKNPLSLGRDTVIERAILRRAIKRDQRRQANQTRQRQAHEQKSGEGKR